MAQQGPRWARMACPGRLQNRTGLPRGAVPRLRLFPFFGERIEPAMVDPAANKEIAMSMGTGIAVGVAIGVAIGVAMDNVAMGIGIGIAIGIAMGGAWQAFGKNKLDE